MLPKLRERLKKGNYTEMNKTNSFFKLAKPIWAKGLQEKRNITIGLYKKIITDDSKAILKIATSGFYKVFLNGSFLGFGPARCAHGFFRVDELALPLKHGENHIAIEAVNYCIESFYYIRQSGFIQAELYINGETAAATEAAADTAFEVFLLNERVRRVQRYSYQRPFAECYRLRAEHNSWMLGSSDSSAQSTDIELCECKRLLPRRIPTASFPYAFPDKLQARGEAMLGVKLKEYFKDRSLTFTSAPENRIIKGYTEDELEIHLSDELQEIRTASLINKATAYSGITELSAGQFEIISLPCEKTGFICAELKAAESSVIYFIFDEILNSANDVNPLRLDCCNAIKLELERGSYHFMSAEPYGFKYLKLLCQKGSVTVKNPHLREVICPVKLSLDFESRDPELNRIISAAKESFIQNSFDLFTDCPTRERAGWLCDSFFIGRAENSFTGKNSVERNFLENYLLANDLKYIPDGMLPMCYPSDFNNSEDYIPNWAMWFVLELSEYKKRTGDTEFTDLFENKLNKLLKFFKRYENSDGLLERLPAWVFVEWSKANDFVQDINFPSNMLYAKMLECSAELLNRPELKTKAEQLRCVIRERSFDGKFFHDNEILSSDSASQKTDNRSETCQYYAFFTGTATPELYPELWSRLLSSFGPSRKDMGTYPEIYPSNAFIGNLLRLELLCQTGNYSQALSEIKGYYLYMADLTGTLWEHDNTSASCNHGFAAYIACLIQIAEQNSI